MDARTHTGIAEQRAREIAGKAKEINAWLHKNSA